MGRLLIALAFLPLLAVAAPAQATDARGGTAPGSHIVQDTGPVVEVTDYWRHRHYNRKFRRYKRLQRFQDNWRPYFERRSRRLEYRADRYRDRGDHYYDKGRYGAADRAYRKSNRLQRRSDHYGGYKIRNHHHKKDGFFYRW